MAKLWEGEISERTISRGFKKISWCSKKRLMAFPERDEVKRQAFIANLSSVPTAQIVYLDESPERWALISTIMVGMKEGSVLWHSNPDEVRAQSIGLQRFVTKT